MKSRLALGVAMVLTIVLSIGGAVLASHQFSDVADSHPFHDEIGAVADAGIVTGYPDGTFRPGLEVTRMALAAMLGRGLSRVAIGTTLDQSTISGTTGGVIGSVTIDVPGSGTATQFVKVDAMVTMAGTGTSCPCNFRLDLNEQGFSSPSGDELFYEFPTTPGYQDSYGTSWVFEATPGTHTYELSMNITTTDTLNLYDLKIIATTYPFGATGGNTLGATMATIEADSVSNEAGK